MSSDGKLRIAIGCTISKNQFLARVIQDDDCIKTKTLKWGLRRTCDEAYKQIVIEAKLLAKQYRCELSIPSKETLLKSSHGKRLTKEETPPAKIPEENPLITKFCNELAFKAMIKHAIKHHGIDKILDVLGNAIALANDMKSEIAKKSSIISAANIEIARVIVRTREQGIDMAAPTKEIESAIQWVIENDNKPKRQAKTEPNATYKLGNEEWNGKDHAPASFSKYLAGNENRSLEDLRVR